MDSELSLAQVSMEGFTAAFEDLVLLLLDRLRRSDPKGQWDNLRLPSIVRSGPLPSALALAPDQVVLALRREVHDIIATAREMHNATVQINTLPHEIMSKIFRMDLEGMLPRKDKRRRGTAALVCRRWKRVVLETPSLWSHWDQNDGLGYVKRAQGLSGATGLTISCTLSETELWEVVRQERRRWEDVTFEVQNISNSLLHSLEELGTGTAPKLRKLKISAPSWHPLPRLTMFATNDPCPLEELSLSRISIDWDAVNFCGLRVLEVGKLTAFGPTVRQLIDILARCNQVQRLTLAGVTMSQEPGRHPPPSPIVLPCLSILELRCGDDDACDIVSGISLPSCKELRVSGFNWRKLSGHHSLPILDVMENIIRIGSTTVLFREDSVYLQKSDNTLRVRFRVGARDAFRWLVTVAGPILNSAPSITLVSEINFDYESSMDILSISSRLRNITALTFRPGFRRMIEPGYFPDCLANLGDQTRHSFPRLQEVSVLVSTISEVESLRNFMARSFAEGMQIQVIHVHFSIPGLLLSQCRNLFQEISAYLPGGQLWVADKLWQAGIDST